ncbi:MAG: hypothetical protein MMC33_004808 [Icmadophila ericetorum]|nr:hypothetical protein [Icmadophila ericetorum]
MLPAPVFTFTIPSIHDDTPLDCRIYHPIRFKNGDNSLSRWKKRGAVIAHPYAPLGGCYDDPVVLAAAAEILKAGFIVARGAGSSKGRTSWTAKPELADYISVVGCFIHYLQELEPNASSSPVQNSRYLDSVPLSPIQSALPDFGNIFDSSESQMILILGGYSYGSMITKNLPHTSQILARFAEVTKGTAEAEIRMRALRLSTQWNKQNRASSRGRSLNVEDARQSQSHSIVTGGEESEPGSRRASRESRRSLDVVRRSVDRSRTKLGLRKASDDGYPSSPPAEEKLGPINVPHPKTHYLLISPLLPPISTFATMFTKFDVEHISSSSQARGTAVDTPDLDVNPISGPTLAIYGDKDFFTSRKKLRGWAEEASQASNSRFRFHEIAGAGHFWHEDGAESQMRGFLSNWIQAILTSA